MPIILIADDDTTLLTCLKDFFEPDGFEVYLADNGRTAWELYRQHQPDVVWLDYDMPEKTGGKVFAAIRAVDRQTLAVIVSGYDLDNNAQQGFYMQGLDLFVPKTYDLVMAKNWIKRQLAKRLRIKPEKYWFGHSELNISSTTLTVCGGKGVVLSEREARILQQLLENKGILVSYDDLLNSASMVIKKKSLNTLANMINELKKKLKKDTSVSLTSRYGKGYILEIASTNMQ